MSHPPGEGKDDYFTSRKEIYMAEIQERVLSVPAISCEHCVKTITETLSRLPGVEAVKTSVSQRTIDLRYDPQRVSLEKITSALDDAGYQVAQ
jgi:copper chaperone